MTSCDKKCNGPHFLNNIKINNNFQFKEWKDTKNVKTIVFAKNIKNNPDASETSCQLNSNNCFKAKPMKHYRKQLINFNSEKITKFCTNNSFINNIDIPKNYTVTNLSIEDLKTSFNDSNLLTGSIYYTKEKNVNTEPSNECKTNCGVIKRATTNINSAKFSQSYNEFLYKKAKSFKQNQFENNNLIKYDSENNSVNYVTCNKEIKNNASNDFNPVSGSTRIANIKYNTINSFKQAKYNEILEKENKKKEIDCGSCKEYKNKLRYKRQLLF
jgi:hypothetical protein